MRRRANEDGQAAVDLIGMVPLLALCAFVVVQVTLIAHSSIVAEQAARASARVAMLTEDAGQARAAAVDSLPSWLRDDVVVTFPTGSVRDVRVSVAVPDVVPGIDLGARVDREVQMPEVESWD